MYFGAKVMPSSINCITHTNYSVPTDYSQFDKGKSTFIFFIPERNTTGLRGKPEIPVRKSTAGLTAPPMGFSQLPVSMRLALLKFTAFQKDEACSLLIFATI